MFWQTFASKKQFVGDHHAASDVSPHVLATPLFAKYPKKGPFKTIPLFSI
jgi:hypothetical protein